jgi:hypothetical protein
MREMIFRFLLHCGLLPFSRYCSQAENMARFQELLIGDPRNLRGETRNERAARLAKLKEAAEAFVIR